MQAAPSGPRNYEEYIKTAPEAGTELTRAEWEAANHGRARASGGGDRQGGNRGDRGGNNRRRRNRRSRRGGRGRHHGDGRPQPRA